MKINKLCRRITTLIDKHPALGLQGWELHVSIVDAVDDVDSKASCSTSAHYDEMWLKFDKGWLKNATDEEIDRVILHELLHAFMRDFNQVTEDLLDYLGEPHRSSVAAAYKHEEEGMVERLARTLNENLRDVVQ